VGAQRGQSVRVREVRVLTASEASTDLLGEIRRVLVDAFGGRFSEADWEHTHGGWRVVVFDADSLVSHAAVVPRTLTVAQRQFHTGYVEGVATTRERRREGLGSLVMAEVSDLVRVWFELGALSTGAHDFYRRSGWERWLGPSFVRDGTELVRTADEDDGLMVLRFGPSHAVDLSAPISCERRSGDDW
jgi:aminoglycoside 2'-N-acetyltransferase I